MARKAKHPRMITRGYLTAEQYDALQAYALQHAPDWRQDLMADWMHARTCGTLHSMRNQYGPTILKSVFDFE